MKRLIRTSLMAMALCACVSASGPPTPQGAHAIDLDAYLATLYVAPASPTAFTAHCEESLSIGAELRARIESAKGPAAIDADFQAYDDIVRLINSASYEAGLVAETNPDETIRAAAEACTEKLSAFATEISLSRPIYDRLSAIDAPGADQATAYALSHALADYRRAGVDRDEATRAQVLALRNAITETGLTFARNIREDQSEVTFPSLAALEGLPEDYLSAHQPGADGLVHISMAYPDVLPIFTYARREDTRRTAYLAFLNRAYPANEAVLHELLAKRYALARLLGYENYAALVMEDKMVSAPARAAQFIEDLAGAARPSAARDYQRQLARLRRTDPRATSVPAWSTRYVNELIRSQDYNVDAQQVRRYFAYNNVRDGMLHLVSDLFGVEFRPWTDAPIWHESVEAYEVYDQGELLGRIFLDMHPRDGKYSHAAMFQIRDGVAGHSPPIGALICNFPAGADLMEHGDVETFLHEFGHLMHFQFAGRQRWTQQYLEWDFIEAPSQLLEEWVWDYDTLARFARDAEGRVIPRDLVARMNAARYFGEPAGTLRQLGFATLSLDYYNRDPSGLDLQGVHRAAEQRYALTPFVEEGHMWASFGHLDGYSAIYYTYEWSRAISLDLFTQFEAGGMRDGATARRYRDLVLAPGGSKSANDLIADFLGRPTSLEAYRRRLEK